MHIGIDLAWGPNGRTGLAAVDDAGRLIAAASVRTDAEIDAWLAQQDRPSVVAIDAPLVVTNPAGRREAERLIGEAYARYDAGAHPTNLSRPHMAPPRAAGLAARHGWSVDPVGRGSERDPVGIEVYPHAGMVGLFQLGRVLPYKRGALTVRRVAFGRLLRLLESVPELALATSGPWESIRARFDVAARPVDLDVLEDEVDAVFCAHLAWLWHGRPEALRVYGDPAGGAIIAPPPPTHPPTARGADPLPATGTRAATGVGPWPGGRDAWPADPRFDAALLEGGDTRNVLDRYRYWTVAAIVADLDSHRHGFSVAIENWQHDLNIGSIVRTANAFAADTVHIVGNRRWDRRGAMVADRYQHVLHHDDVVDLVGWAARAGLPIVAVDNVPGARAIQSYPLPERCVLLFGQEGPGLTAQALEAADAVVEIPQYGSTRSINAAAAAAIVMHEWVRRWADGGRAPGGGAR